MRLVLATMALSISAVVLFGCDAGGGGTPVSTANPVQIEQFAAQYAQASCTQNFKCCGAADLSGRTITQCMTDNASGLSLLATLISDGKAKHRLSYDPAKMGACITAVGSLSCTDWKRGFTVVTNQPEICKAAVVAQVFAGGACLEDIECTTGHCEGADFSVTPAVDGKCAGLPALGDSCAQAGLCAEGFYCDGDSQICLDRKPAGEACTSDEECMNSCNLTTGLCSCYVGCAVSDPAPPRPALLSSLLVGATILLAARRRARPSR